MCIRDRQIIDLATSTIPSSYLLPELLAGFGRMYPDVCFHSWQTDSSGAINRVLDGTVDPALTGQNTGDDSCVFIPFCQDNMVCLLYTSFLCVHAILL